MSFPLSNFPSAGPRVGILVGTFAFLVEEVIGLVGHKLLVPEVE